MTVLVTGASAGIGKATANYLAQNGYHVYGAARRMGKMQDFKTYGIKPIALDITKNASMVGYVTVAAQVVSHRHQPQVGRSAFHAFLGDGPTAA